MNKAFLVKLLLLNFLSYKCPAHVLLNLLVLLFGIQMFVGSYKSTQLNEAFLANILIIKVLRMLC